MTVLIVSRMFVWLSIILLIVSHPLRIGLVIIRLSLAGCVLRGMLVTP